MGMESKNVQLGTNGIQFALFVAYNNRSAHAHFTRPSKLNKDGDTHHTSEIILDEKVSNGDEFRIICNMKKAKCDIYHNEQLLIDVFSHKIPNKIIPAISGYAKHRSISCCVDFVPST